MKELIAIEQDLPVAKKKLDALARKASDTAPVRKAIGEYLLSSTEERFSTQTGPDGEKWAELKPATRKRKKHPKILTEQGHLRGDVHYALRDDSLLLGVALAYGAIHQLGGEIDQPARTGVVTHFRKAGKSQRFSKAQGADYTRKLDHPAHTVKMPARPYLGVSQADEAEVLAIVEDYLQL